MKSSVPSCPALFCVCPSHLTHACNQTSLILGGWANPISQVALTTEYSCRWGEECLDVCVRLLLQTRCGHMCSEGISTETRTLSWGCKEMSVCVGFYLRPSVSHFLKEHPWVLVSLTHMQQNMVNV